MCWRWLRVSRSRRHSIVPSLHSMNYRREDSRVDTMGGMLISLVGDGGRDELGIEVHCGCPFGCQMSGVLITCRTEVTTWRILPGTARFRLTGATALNSPATSNPPTYPPRTCSVPSLVAVHFHRSGVNRDVGEDGGSPRRCSVHDLIAVDKHRIYSSHSFFSSVHWAA